MDLNTSLKAGGRVRQSDGGLHIRRHSLRGLLLVSELTLSLMLLIGAGLLTRSFVRLRSVPPGFTTDHVLTTEVGAVKPYGLETDGKIAVYFPQNQRPNLRMFLAMRTSSHPAGLTSAVVSEIHRSRSGPGGLWNADYAGTSGRFAGAPALFKHHAGDVCGFRFAAGCRRSVRCDVAPGSPGHSRYRRFCYIIIGARPGKIIGLVMRQGMELAGVGIVLGLAGGVALTRVMASLLFGVSTTDVATFAAVSVLLATVAFAATAIPAWRATRVDPMVVLREE